jgi:hypothetical protein
MELQRTVIRRQRLRPLPLFLKDHAEIEPVRGPIGLFLRRLQEQLDRFRQLPDPVRNESQQMERFGVMRIDDENFPVQALRVIEPPGAMMKNGLIEEWLQRQRRTALLVTPKLLLTPPVSPVHETPLSY